MQAQHGAQRAAVGRALLAQLHFQGGAAAQAILEQQRRRRQVVDHHVQVAVVVQVAEAHAAPALRGVQPPLRRRQEAPAAGVAQRLVFFHQLIPRQVGEDFGRDHAVHHVQVEVAVVVQVAELGRPAPAGGVHPGGLGGVDERVAAACGRPRVQHVGGDLHAVGGLQVGAFRPQRPPDLFGGGVAVVRLHVGGQQLGAPVVVEVALGEAHGVDGSAGEGRRLAPAAGRVEVDHVGGREVVADQDVAPPVAVQIGEQHRQRVGAPAQPFEGEQAGAVVAVEEHAAADHHTIRQRAQLGVVGGAHHVQVAVQVEIRPRHGVSGKPGAEPLILHPRERGTGAGRAGRRAPPGGQAAGVGEHEVDAGVAVDVHGIDGAGHLRRQVAAAKEQVPLVPEQGGGPVQAGQDDVDAAVLVQVRQRHAGAVAVEEADELVRPAGVVGERLHVEPPRALARVGAQRRAQDRDAGLGVERARRRAEGANDAEGVQPPSRGKARTGERAAARGGLMPAPRLPGRRHQP